MLELVNITCGPTLLHQCELPCSVLGGVMLPVMSFSVDSTLTSFIPTGARVAVPPSTRAPPFGGNAEEWATGRLGRDRGATVVVVVSEPSVWQYAEGEERTHNIHSTLSGPPSSLLKRRLGGASALDSMPSLAYSEPGS